MLTGTVKFFNQTKGFGFMVNETSEQDVFFHVNNGRGMKISCDNSGVTFDNQTAINGPSKGDVLVYVENDWDDKKAYRWGYKRSYDRLQGQIDQLETKLTKDLYRILRYTSLPRNSESDNWDVMFEGNLKDLRQRYEVKNLGRGRQHDPLQSSRFDDFGFDYKYQILQDGEWVSCSDPR